jgi:hypothetical protein
VTVKKAGGTSTDVGVLPVELLVLKTYAGALRVGAGLIFSKAVDRAYAAQKVNNAGQAEIVATETGDVDLELVVGFTFYIENFIGMGRSYLHRTWWQYLGLYAGFGLLAKDKSIFDGFLSFYTGLDFEVGQHFSITPALAIRRVTRLRDGFEVGNPVSETTGVPTEMRTVPGFALLFNFSPDILKLTSLSGIR